MGESEFIVVSMLHQTITVHGDGDRSERYSLFRFDTGDVYWRLDEFRHVDGTEWEWVRMIGRVSVADVARRVPVHARIAFDWTQREIELGTLISDDIFSAARREEALERLTHELAAALPEAA